MTMSVGLTMFWSIFAGQFGFGQFWPKKLVMIDFGQNSGFRRFWLKTLGFDRKKWF